MNLIYEGRDITQSVQILQCVHRDASVGRSDSLDIILNHAADWYRWKPKAGDTIEINHKGYTTGTLYVNTVRPEGKEYRILATSLPPNAWQNAWRSYRQMTFDEIVTQCATECGMVGEVYGARFSTPYGHLQRKNTGAAAFLQRLCFLEGAALKAYNGKMQAIFIPYAQDQRTVRSLRLTGEETGLVYTHTPEAKRGFVRVVTPDFEVTVTDSGASGCKGKVISAPAMDTITASRWARGVLLMCNRMAETLEVSIGFDPAMTAMARVEVIGNSAFAGGWLVDEAEHDLYNERTRVKLVRCVTTVSESASITLTEATGSTTRRIAPEVEAELVRIEGLIPTEPATATTDGLMSATDKAKLDGIEAEANKYTHPTYTARTGQPTANKTPGFGETFTISQIKSDSSGHVTAATNRTVKIPDAEATQEAHGLMSSTDKAKLDGIEAEANKYTHPAYTSQTGKPTGNQTPGFGETFTVSQIKSDATGHVTAATDRTVKIPDTEATSEAHGLMSATDKAKLEGIEAEANKYVHPAYTARTGKPTGNQTPGFGATFTISQIKSDATGHVTAATDRTVKIPDAEATQEAHGLMSSTDKAKLDAFGAASTYALKTDLTAVYKYKGSKATVSALPSSGNVQGDVWDVQENGMNYAWNGSAWDPLGTIYTPDIITDAQIDAICV